MVHSRIYVSPAVPEKVAFELFNSEVGRFPPAPETIDHSPFSPDAGIFASRVVEVIPQPGLWETPALARVSCTGCESLIVFVTLQPLESVTVAVYGIPARRPVAISTADPELQEYV